MSRTLQNALDHATHLRDFRKVNGDAFERSADYQDIILLADEVGRLEDYLKGLSKRIITQTKEQYPLICDKKLGSDAESDHSR